MSDRTCGIYVRVSTTKQENENQLAELREFANKQGWRIAEEFIDTASGRGEAGAASF